jgi:hypothetical protein
MKRIFILLFAGFILCACSANKNEKLQKENRQLKEKLLELEKETQLRLEKENQQLKEKLRELEGNGARADDPAKESAEPASKKLIDVLTQLGEQVSPNEMQAKYGQTMDLIRRIGSAMEAFITDHAEPPSGDSIYQLMKTKGLIPVYLKIPIFQDAWGNDLYYQSRMDRGRRSYWIGSGGSDGSFVGFEQEWTQQSTAGIDVIYSNGEFILYPLAYK